MAKKATRVGMSARGKVIHIIVGKNNQAICEKKQIKLIVNPKLTLNDVTCKRCRQTQTFKDGISNMSQPAPVPEPVSAFKEPSLGIPKTQLKPEPDPDNAFLSKQMKDGSFKIIHKATNKTFFSQIEEEVIKKAMNLLNALPATWASTHDKLPSNFIFQCREAVELAYNQVNVTLPEALKIPKGQQNKRAIKRRNKKTKDKKKNVAPKIVKKSRSTRIFHFIFAEMQEGIALNDLTTKIATEFKLTQKRSTGNIKKSIRKMRKKNIVITIKTRPDKVNDLYAIKEDD
jgi:hypothetical protein